MKLEEAKQECERWLSYLKGQKEKSVALQKIASDVRNGFSTSEEGRKKQRLLDGHHTVYDGAKLADAVRLLLRQTPKCPAAPP